jgi:hypothetical protein
MRWTLGAVLLIASGCAEASFFPGSGPRLPPNKASAPWADQDKALQAVQHFELRTAPLVSERGGHLRVVLETQDPKVNAEARREERDWGIIVYGGMLRHPRIGEAELTLVLCHELGHHLGGEPTAARGGWSACEGQADYWSTHGCFQRVRPGDDARAAALRLTELYATMSGGAFPSHEAKDETVRARTWFGYPSPQCRLDTLLAGLAGRARPRCWMGP